MDVLYRGAAPSNNPLRRTDGGVDMTIGLRLAFSITLLLGGLFNPIGAKALGLTIPPSLLGRADEVIQ